MDHIFGPEIEVVFFPVVVKADMAINSVPEVAVFVEFGLVALDVYLGRGNRNLSGQGSLLGQGVRAGYQAENYHQQESSGIH